jgi:hypothetical protein
MTSQRSYERRHKAIPRVPGGHVQHLLQQKTRLTPAQACSRPRYDAYRDRRALGCRPASPASAMAATDVTWAARQQVRPVKTPLVALVSIVKICHENSFSLALCWRGGVCYKLAEDK